MDNLTGIIKHPNESGNEIVIFLNNSEKFTEVEDGLKLSISKNDFYAAINMILDNINLSNIGNFVMVIPPIIGNRCKCCGREIKD